MHTNSVTPAGLGESFKHLHCDRRRLGPHLVSQQEFRVVGLNVLFPRWTAGESAGRGRGRLSDSSGLGEGGWSL
jgi:hypothetical protein